MKRCFKCDLLLVFFYSQIVGRGNDQVAITTKFETRDDMCRFSKLNHTHLHCPFKLRAQRESGDTCYSVSS